MRWDQPLQGAKHVIRQGADPAPALSETALDRLRARDRLQQSIAQTLCVIAAARAERTAAPVSAARGRLAAVYGAIRLQRRLEREHSAA